MLTVDGLVTGLDTASIIEGLLASQQNQIDRLNLRKQEVVQEQTAFRTLEANLASLQSQIGTLLSTTNSVFDSKQVTSSDEESLVAAADSDAAVGVYAFRVNQLASSHQVATSRFDSAAEEISTGSFSLRVGTGSPTTVEIDENNNTVQGLADAINSQSDDVTAAVIREGFGDSSQVRILLSSNKTGESNSISIEDDGTFHDLFDFDTPVQAGQNARVQIGSGEGAIILESATNQFDEAIPGLTLDLLRADPEKVIEVNVSQDTTAAEDAITDFVDGYNTFVEFINQNNSYDAETGTAGVFLGSSAANSILQDVRNAVAGPVVGIDGRQSPNLLSRIGITTDDQGKLAIDRGDLNDALTGDDGFSLNEFQDLFALQGNSTNPGISFVLGTHRTQPSSLDDDNTLAGIEIDVTTASTRAVLTASGTLSEVLTFDSTNDQLRLNLDGTELDVFIPHGEYSASEIPNLLQQVINDAPENRGRVVDIRLTDDQRLEITSASYGSGSQIEFLDLLPTDEGTSDETDNVAAAASLASTSREGRFDTSASTNSFTTDSPAEGAEEGRGAAATLLGLATVEAVSGQDVGGVFRYDDPDNPGEVITETALGSGRILTGNRTRTVREDDTSQTVDQRTADLRVRVDLAPGDLTPGNAEATMTLTQGVAARLDTAIRQLLDIGTGQLATVDDRFDAQVAAIDDAIELTAERMDARETSLLRRFASLESTVAQLNSIGNSLTSTLLGI